MSQAKGYTLTGTLASVEKAATIKDETYLKGRLTFVTAAGATRTCTAMCFDRALGEVGGNFVEGATTLFGVFDGPVFVALRKQGRKAEPSPQPAVSGHHRWQRHGAGNEGRKVLWIEPKTRAGQPAAA